MDKAYLSDSRVINIKKPRTVSRQTIRDNIPSENDMDYYRKAVYIPYLDSLLQQLKDRFDGHNSTVFNFAAVIAAFASQYSFTDLAPVVGSRELVE